MKPDRLYRKLNDEFGRCLVGAFQVKFGIEIETNWNIVSMAKMTSRVDEKPLTAAQRDFISAYSAGYYRAAHEATNG